MRISPLGEGKVIVQVVLPHDWVARINRLAVDRGLNRSALIRAAIAASYFEVGDAASADRGAAAVPQPSHHTREEEECHT